MIGLPSTVKIFLITEPTDMRKGLYSLADVVKRLGHNPLSGHLFVFLSSSGDRCTILFWSDGGFIAEHININIITPLRVLILLEEL